MDHELRPFSPELSRFNSTRALHDSAVYEKLRPEIERILQTVVEEHLAPDVTTAQPSRCSSTRIFRYPYRTRTAAISRILIRNSICGSLWLWYRYVPRCSRITMQPRRSLTP